MISNPDSDSSKSNAPQHTKYEQFSLHVVEKSLPKYFSKKGTDERDGKPDRDKC